MFCTDRSSLFYGFLVDPSGVALFCTLLGAVMGIGLYLLLDLLGGPRK